MASSYEPGHDYWRVKNGEVIRGYGPHNWRYRLNTTTGELEVFYTYRWANAVEQASRAWEPAPDDEQAQEAKARLAQAARQNRDQVMSASPTSSVSVPTADLHRILQSFVAHSHTFIGNLNRNENPRIAREIVALEEEIALAQAILRDLEGDPQPTAESPIRPTPSPDTLQRWAYALWCYFNNDDADVDERMSALHKEIASFAKR